jgi:Nucleoside diphosphate kinase
MNLEKTLVILKPDAMSRRLAGKILSRFEEKGLAINAMKMMKITKELAQQHYAEHKEKPFFGQLVGFITSRSVIVMALEGVEAIAVVRKMLGATSGRAAEPGSIRGDFGISKSFNLVHASDSPESAKRELALFFNDAEFMPSATKDELGWNYEYSEGGPN